MSEQQVVKVAEVFVVKTDEQILGVEAAFTENVLNKGGASTVLDYARQALDNSAWVYNTINRVEDRDAQTDTQPEGDGGGDTQAPPPIDTASDEPEGYS